MAAAVHGDDDQTIESTRSTLAAMIRSAIIRYSIVLPKIKAANFFQPEDHVKNEHIKGSTFSSRTVGMAHTASIFGAGTVLFVLQERTLRKLEPETNGDFGRASPQAAAVAGGVGGLGYAVCATATHAWLGTETRKRQWWLDARSFFRRALPYTLPRDMGGFAVYFGVYAFSHKALLELFRGAAGSGVHAAAPSDPAPADGTDAAPMSSARQDFSLLSVSTSGELAGSLSAIATSGALSGLCTYMWRTPFDTMYKRSVGWRDENAPLWSFRRFLRSPRGVKAVVVGAATWSAYEVADASLRHFIGEHHVAPPEQQAHSR